MNKIKQAWDQIKQIWKNMKKVWDRTRNRVSLALRLLRMLFFKGIAACVPHADEVRTVWLFSERGDAACDNAWHLFCYVRAHMPEIRAYYILEKGAPDREKVAAVGKVLTKNSTRHALFYFLPTVKISTHLFGASPDLPLMNSHKGRKLLTTRGKTVFLQHGILKDDIPALYAGQTNFDLFVCGAAPEFDFVRARYGYPDETVALLGMARYDALLSAKPKRQILLMPTWRAAFSSLSAEAFATTEFFCSLDTLLHSPALAAFLEKADLTLTFAFHTELARFAPLFTAPSPRIIFGTPDVGEAVRESAVLLTDYSSVAFDFAFARRPVVYLALPGMTDANYPRGWFDRDHDGFGSIVQNEEKLLSALRELVKNGFTVSKTAAKNADAVFPVRDADACLRLAERITALTEQTE